MDTFDVQKFYTELDQYFAGYDNAATEQFLKDERYLGSDQQLPHL